MKRTSLILFALCSLLFDICFSLRQESYGQPSITWQRVYNGPLNDRDLAYGITESIDGYFYTVGYTRYPDYRIYILKLSQYGDTLWSRIIASGVGQIAYAVTASNDGGCVVTGQGASSFTIKLGSAGNLVWQNSYGGSDIKCFDIKRTADGGYIACGYTRPGSPLYGYILKIDSSGNLQWQRTYPAGRTKVFNAIEEIIGEGYILAGVFSESVQDTAKGYILKIDSLGNVIWEVRYKVNNRSTAFGSISNINGGYLLGAALNDVTYDTSWSGFVRTDLNGNVVHTTVFPSTRRFDEFWDMKPINQNRYVLTTWVLDSVVWPTLYFKARARICDSLGNIIREKLFFNGEDEFFSSVLSLSNGDIVFAGASWSFSNNGWEDVYVVRTDSLLNAPPVGIISYNKEIPDEFELYQNYPNPFNSETRIKFNLPVTVKVKLIIYDILGREVAVLVNSLLKSGVYEVNFEASELPSGIYLYKLSAYNLSITRKMVFIK